MKYAVLGDSLPINSFPALTMHVDINSCFATVEQQANRFLRDRKIAVAAYDTPKGFIVTASYPAKRAGVRLGMRVAEAKSLVPDIVILTPDPPKYRTVHKAMYRILKTYSDQVVPKSIDEFVMTLDDSLINRAGMEILDMAADIKNKIRREIGEAVTVNVGIGSNRFLAKLAARFFKPDGMFLIDSKNLLGVYKNLTLTDLPGISHSYKARLNANGINSPLELLNTSQAVLHKRVFKSIVGKQWYMKLRGYEVDDYQTKKYQIGRQHAVLGRIHNGNDLMRIIFQLVNDVGFKLREAGLSAGGVSLRFDFFSDNNEVFAGFNKHAHRELNVGSQKWSKSHKVGYRLYSTHSIYSVVKYLINSFGFERKIRVISVSVFDLQSANSSQTSLFNFESSQKRDLVETVDSINHRFGLNMITYGSIMSTTELLIDRIAFGKPNKPVDSL